MHRLSRFLDVVHPSTPRPEDHTLGEDGDVEESIPLTPSAAPMGYGGSAHLPARRVSGYVKRNNRSEAQRLPSLMQKTSDFVASPSRFDTARLTTTERWRLWLVNNGQRRVFVLLWVVLHVLVFGFGMVTWQVSDDWNGARRTYGLTFAIAKSAALALNVDVAFILLPVCRNFITMLRRTPLNGVVPFDAGVTFHKAVAWSMVFWSAVHIVAHMLNFSRAAIEAAGGFVEFLKLNFVTGPGITGWIMTACLAVMVTFAMEKRKRVNFERFWFSHHLFILLFIAWQLHGMFCMIRPDRPPYCSFNSVASFWKYWMVGGVLYIGERVLREVRSRRRTYISKVIQHPSRVVEIQIKTSKMTPRAGQYIFLNCPEISYWQWHPFTLTSAPEEEFISVHIRMVGDYTVALARILGCGSGQPLADAAMSREPKGGSTPTMNRILPRIMVDGPFGSASEDFYKFETIMLCGAGIGVTPFASILKSIWYRANYPSGKSIRLQKVYFIWICRDFESFEWFQSLLLAIEAQDLDNLIEIHTYITSKLTLDEISNVTLSDVGADRDPVTGLRAPTLYGRPNWNALFKAMVAKHPATDVGVFFCGPKGLGHDLHLKCKAYTSALDGGTRFCYGKENF